jgi:allophanate hydrolase subunit 1
MSVSVLGVSRDALLNHLRVPRGGLGRPRTRPPAGSVGLQGVFVAVLTR